MSFFVLASRWKAQNYYYNLSWYAFDSFGKSTLKEIKGSIDIIEY